MNRAATLLLPLVLLACRTSETPPEEDAPVLERKASCQRCEAALQSEAEAFACSYECTFCAACTRALEAVCPNCGGELKPRPRRAL